MKRFVLPVVFAGVLLAGCATSSGDAQKISSQRESARIHTELGAGYYAQNQLAIALEEFTIATKTDPAYAMGHNGLGLVYGVLREDEKAETSFRKALQLDPRSAESHNNYGSFLCSRNRIDESVPHFLEAVKNPLYATPEIAYMNAGLCSLRKKDMANAETYFKNAVQLQPLLFSASYQLALINFERGQYLVAREYLQSAMAGEPTAEMLWLGVRIERLLGDRNAEASHALLLRKKYPDSEQAKALLSGR